MAAPLFFVGHASTKGLTMTSIRPEPTAYVTTEITSPAYGFGIRSGREAYQTERGKYMRRDNTDALSQTVDEKCGKIVDEKLTPEIQGDQKCDFCAVDAVAVLKCQKQQGCEIVDDGLYHISRVGRADGSAEILCLFHNTLRFRKS